MKEHLIELQPSLAAFGCARVYLTHEDWERRKHDGPCASRTILTMFVKDEVIDDQLDARLSAAMQRAR